MRSQYRKTAGERTHRLRGDSVMPLCEDCDSLHVCYVFLSIKDLINPKTGKYHKLTGGDGESYWYGDEITKHNDKEYAAYIKRIRNGE